MSDTILNTVDALCDDWSEKGIALCRFIMNARNPAVLALRRNCSGPHVAEAADRIIALRTAEQPLWREFTDERGIVVCVPTNCLSGD